MISAIRIQNFKSIKDETVHLNKLNLLIGANNAGKSNFLKALRFLSRLMSGWVPNQTEFQNVLFQHKDVLMGRKNQQPLAFSIFQKAENDTYVFRIEMYDMQSYTAFVGLVKDADLDLNFTLTNVNYLGQIFYGYYLLALNNSYIGQEVISDPNLRKQILKISATTNFGIYKHSPQTYPTVQQESKDLPKFLMTSFAFDGFEEELIDLFNQVKIYKPDIEKITKPYPLESDESVNQDASNLISFFDRMKDIQGEVIDSINKDLNKCIPEFKDLRFDTIKKSDSIFEELKRIYDRDTFKKLGVADNNRNIYWAEDLSDGALYFIALLAIIHQPNPPKLLLLEEPDKGIHPKRITEVIYYLQKLADDKNIQIIVTSHSPVVLDQFAHDPSSVLVFDKEQYITSIRSMGSIISEKKKKQKKTATINYEEELSENWLMGLLNGIPND